MTKEDIVFLPSKEDFNGVLIILREPGGGSNGSEQEDFEGCQRWFEKILKNENLSSKGSSYRNRFCEMLRVCGKSAEDISHIAYTNIKKSAGGAKASKEYREIPPDEKKSIINDIVSIVEPEIVFLCKDAFSAVAESEKAVEDGVKYQNTGHMRSVTIDGVNYFEIFHPSYRRRIDDSSKLVKLLEKAEVSVPKTEE